MASMLLPGEHTGTIRRCPLTTFHGTGLLGRPLQLAEADCTTTHRCTKGLTIPRKEPGQQIPKTLLLNKYRRSGQPINTPERRVAATTSPPGSCDAIPADTTSKSDQCSVIDARGDTGGTRRASSDRSMPYWRSRRYSVERLIPNSWAARLKFPCDSVNAFMIRSVSIRC